MYSYLKGKVVKSNSDAVIFEVNNIGYEIKVSNPFSFNDDVTKIYIYQHVREDEQTFYGFKTEEDKYMFLDLISVKGIGPKTALAILAASEISYIKNAIIQEDTKYLQKFPKIGKKAAQQIIIDLSGKYSNDELMFTNNKIEDIKNEEVIEALTALGYAQKDIKKYIKEVDNSLSTEEKIKEVLVKMMR